MPATPRWLLAIPDAIQQLEALDRDLLTRRDVEQLFGVSRARAATLMQTFGAALTGHQRTLPRAQLLRQLRKHRARAAFRLSWNMQGLDPRIYPVTVRVLDTPYRLGTGITATLHVENFVPNAAPAISLICAPRFQPQSGASNPCTATLDTPAIGSDGARIDFGAVVTDLASYQESVWAILPDTVSLEFGFAHGREFVVD